MKRFGTVLAIGGLLTLGYWVAGHLRSRLYQVQAEERFARESPAPVRPEPGSAIARIEIPRLGMSAMVVEGADQRSLKLGPGHIRGTAYPGKGGNVGFAGHRDTFFRPLRHARESDSIDVTTPNGSYRYTIASMQVVEPGNVRVLDPTERESLTLITCYPFDFLGAAPKRFVIRAERQDYRPIETAGGR